MKKKTLEQKIKEAGWYLLRQGGNHEIWTNGADAEPIPRHREINELLAKNIIKKCLARPGKKKE